MYCSGHVGRQHRKQLQTLSKMKRLTKEFIARNKLHTTESDKDLSCHCKGKHKKACGCMSAAFICRAVLNHAMAVVESGRDTDRYRQTLMDLGSHRARDEHAWDDDQQCCWHEPVNEDGQPYHTTNPLKCAFHARAYEIECLRRAAKADRAIHPELGKGHSNLPEAAHNVALSFRQKDKNLKRLNYVVRTNEPDEDDRTPRNWLPLVAGAL